MRLFLGVVTFSIVTVSIFFLLSKTMEWPIEVIIISSLFLGGSAEWLFYKLKASTD